MQRDFKDIGGRLGQQAKRDMSVIQGRKGAWEHKDRKVLQAFKASKGTMVTSVPLALRVQKDLQALQALRVPKAYRAHLATPAQ